MGVGRLSQGSRKLSEVCVETLWRLWGGCPEDVGRLSVWCG